METLLLNIVGLTGRSWTLLTEDAAKDVVDVQVFVHKVASSIKRNPILVACGAKYMGFHGLLHAFGSPANSSSLFEERQEELRLAAAHSFVMHAITSALLFENTSGPLWKMFVSNVQQKRDSMPWMDGCRRIDCRYVNLFEIAKVATVDVPMGRFTQVKTGKKSVDDMNKNRQTLSVNIFEAMLQDVKQGNVDNAEAGFEMMSEPYGRRATPGLDSDIFKE